MSKIDAMPISPSVNLNELFRFVKEVIIPRSRGCDATEEFPWDVYENLHRQGWLQAFIPKELGGAGLCTTDLASIARMIAYGSAGVFSTFTVNILGMSPVLLYGSRELKERLGRDFLENFYLWSYAMTEPDTGSHIAQTQTRARKIKDGYLLSGKKCFITNATYSKHLSVFARIEGSDPEKPEICVFYVPGDSKGLSRGVPMKKLGQHDSNTAELFFDEVFVPEQHRIGAEGQGLRIAFHCLQRSKTLIAAAAVGMCDRAMDLAQNHLAHRELYGEPLLKLPVIHHQLAQLQTEAQAAWLLTCLAAKTWECGDFAVKEASMAKLFATHTAVQYISEVLELFGGYGYSCEYEIEKLYRDVRVLEIYEGPTLVQQQLIARELFPDIRDGGVINRKLAA